MNTEGKGVEVGVGVGVIVDSSTVAFSTGFRLRVSLMATVLGCISINIEVGESALIWKCMIMSILSDGTVKSATVPS